MWNNVGAQFVAYSNLVSMLMIFQTESPLPGPLPFCGVLAGSTKPDRYIQPSRFKQARKTVFHVPSVWGLVVGLTNILHFKKTPLVTGSATNFVQSSVMDPSSVNESFLRPKAKVYLAAWNGCLM